MDLSQIRSEFLQAHLDEQQIPSDPVVLVEQWLEQAVTAQCSEPTAMSVATVSPQGQPSNRIVYLKGIESGNFLFFTNTQSRKGSELASNPRISAVLFWPILERQVRIEGSASPLPAEQSDHYFASRPRLSQLGAWASQQSQVITDRSVLTAQYEAAKKQYPQEVPRPSHWGGYRIEPRLIEFWQGRPGRMHDRLCYQHLSDQWQIQRLSP